MSKSNLGMPDKKYDKNSFSLFYALSIAWQLGFLIAIPIALFIFLGHLADVFLKTSPILLFVGLIAGVIITIYEVYNLLVPIVKNKK